MNTFCTTVHSFDTPYLTHASVQQQYAKRIIKTNLRNVDKHAIIVGGELTPNLTNGYSIKYFFIASFGKCNAFIACGVDDCSYL